MKTKYARRRGGALCALVAGLSLVGLTACSPDNAEEQYKEGVSCAKRKDTEKAAEWFRKAAAQGDSIAIMALRKYGLRGAVETQAPAA